MARTAEIIGAPTDYGTDRRGVDMGPSAIRYAGLSAQIEATGLGCRDAGNVEVPIVEEADRAETALVKFLDETEAVCNRVADAVAGAIDDDRFPIVLGGDHSIAIGSLLGSSRETNIGVLWLDAHGDFNTPETSPSGNVHGMPLAATFGHGSFADEGWAQASVDETNLVWIGLRSLDTGERERIRESPATAYTMTDIDRRGIAAVVEEAIEIATDGVDGLHVSLDLDWLEPTEAPGVGTPVAGGVSYREAHFALELIAERVGDDLRSMDIVEVNPILDTHNETAELATELAASALGKRIL